MPWNCEKWQNEFLCNTDYLWICMTNTVIYFNIFCLRGKRIGKSWIVQRGKRIEKCWIVQSQMMKINFSATLLTHISEFFKKAYAYLRFLYFCYNPVLESEVLILLSQETIAGFCQLLCWKEEGMLEQWQEFKIKKEFEEIMTEGFLWFGLDIWCDLAGITLFHLSSLSWLAEVEQHGVS